MVPNNHEMMTLSICRQRRRTEAVTSEVIVKDIVVVID
jgi:hypothetical protein